MDTDTFPGHLVRQSIIPVKGSMLDTDDFQDTGHIVKCLISGAFEDIGHIVKG